MIEKLDINKTLTENARIIGLHPDTLSKKVRKLGIKLPDGRGSKPKVLINPFVLGIPENEYWLGYFMGDGNLSKNGKTISMSSVSDIEHLLTFLDHAPGTNSYCDGYKMIVYFGNKEVVKYLNSLNIFSNKSLNLNPNFEINWNIFRGLFDADGSVCNKSTIKITTGSPKLAATIQQFLAKNGFIANLYYKGNAIDVALLFKKGYTDTLSNKKRRKLFFDKMYENTYFLMERKYLQIRATFQ